MFISKIFFETQSGGIYIVLVAHGISILFHKFKEYIRLSKRKSEHFPHFPIHNTNPLIVWNANFFAHFMVYCAKYCIFAAVFKREVPWEEESLGKSKVKEYEI